MFSKKKKNIEGYNIKTIPLEIDSTQIAKMTPAVTFAPPSITTLTGESVPNGGVYSTFIKVNNMCMDFASGALNNGADPRFVSTAIDIASNNIFDTIVDSFVNAIYNHYTVYLSRVNLIIADMFSDIDHPPVAPLYPKERNYEFYRGNQVYRGTREFINLSPAERNVSIDTGAFSAFAIGAANAMGAGFYNEALTKISEALAFFDGDKEFLQTKVVNNLNNVTSSMMVELAHESSQFCENIRNFNSNILSRSDILSIKYANEPEKLDFSKKREEEYDHDEYF